MVGSDLDMETEWAAQFARSEIARLREALTMMTDDCEHLLNILEGKAEQEWNYDHQRERIARVRTALDAGKRHLRPALPSIS